jgi:hypothetical protein
MALATGVLDRLGDALRIEILLLQMGPRLETLPLMFLPPPVTLPPQTLFHLLHLILLVAPPTLIVVIEPVGPSNSNNGTVQIEVAVFNRL